MKPWVALAGLGLGVQRKRLLRATFVERPHRFAAAVVLRNGERVQAHLPNPGRLTSVISPGCEALLDGPFPPRRALPYTMVAARQSGIWIGTNTMYANRVFPSLLAVGLFPELATGSPRPEVRHGHSRFDFQVGAAFVEVKSVTLARDGGGFFPDAVTERGARHCKELGRAARRGTPAAIVFVAQRSDVTSVEPDDEVDPAFGAALRTAAKSGVLVLACALDIEPDGARTARRIPVRL